MTPPESSVADQHQPADEDGLLVFTAADGELTVIDFVEGYRYTLATTDGVDPTPVETEPFTYPVDAAVKIRTDHVAVRGDVPAAYVRDSDWGMVAETDPPADLSFPADEYYVEICAPIKLFVHVEGAMAVTATTNGKEISFDEERTVRVGAFSKHDQPSATITTTDDPRDVMAAVSTFGSALKTTSPERSFPNQRGHPPALALGDELSIPDGLAAPDTGVTIEIPPEFQYVYPVSPLAYYLGADVVAGPTPRLRTDRGLAYDLAPDGHFEREVERVLKQTFLLDCITRTEGLYPVELAERQAVEPLVDLEFEALYDQSIAERLAAYLEVDYETVAPHVPEWKLTADVAATAEVVETLSFVVNDLAVVRTDARPVQDGPSARQDGDGGEASAAIDSLLRGADDGVAAATPSVVDLPSVESLERTWVGDGVLSGASKAMAAAYRNRMDQGDVEGDIGVTVVCNDQEMGEEQSAINAVYGASSDSPVEVSVRQELTTEELRGVLSGDANFLHYIGHIDERGFECVDGWLDVATLEGTGVDTFLLNACTSYEQGMALIEAGAVGGIVTLAEVHNGSAVRVGSTIARLLNAGYPLRPAMDIARTTLYSSHDYMVVGDGNAVAVSREDCLANLYKVDRDGDQFSLEIVSYLSMLGGMGDIITPYLEGVDRYYLGAGRIDTFDVSDRELARFLQLDEVPVLVDKTLYWPDEITVADL